MQEGARSPGTGIRGESRSPTARQVRPKALKAHPETIAPTAKGRDTIVRVLASLSQVAVGVAELRNEYGTDHGRTRPSKGLGPATPIWPSTPPTPTAASCSKPSETACPKTAPHNRCCRSADQAGASRHRSVACLGTGRDDCRQRAFAEGRSAFALPAYTIANLRRRRCCIITVEGTSTTTLYVAER